MLSPSVIAALEATKKVCYECKKEKIGTEFYGTSALTNGKKVRCKECHKGQVRKHYGQTREQRLEYERARGRTDKRKQQLAEASARARSRNPEKYRAHNIVAGAIRRGKLRKGPCEVCGKTDKVQAHHDDYSRPLAVRWLCVMCHKRHHGHTPF